MKKQTRTQIGSFTVVNNNNERQEVIISQDTINHYSATTNHTKNLNLDTLDGPPVFKTEDPSIFRLQDETILRRRAH
jgi:hypothetical protein